MWGKVTCGLGVVICIAACVNEIVCGDTKTAMAWGVAAIWAFNAFIRAL